MTCPGRVWATNSSAGPVSAGSVLTSLLAGAITWSYNIIIQTIINYARYLQRIFFIRLKINIYIISKLIPKKFHSNLAKMKWEMRDAHPTYPWRCRAAAGRWRRCRGAGGGTAGRGLAECSRPPAPRFAPRTSAAANRLQLVMFDWQSQQINKIIKIWV